MGVKVIGRFQFGAEDRGYRLAVLRFSRTDRQFALVPYHPITPLSYDPASHVVRNEALEPVGM